jgi:hypothetical protein
VPEAAVACGEANGEVHGGMVRHVEQEHLRRADGEKRQRLGLGGQALDQALSQRRPDRAEAPEGRGRDRLRESLVAGIEPRPARKVVEGVVQRRAPP